jgi:uncharacterized protein YaeQ
MAISSTIFRCKLNIADLDRGYYADHALVLARHPSETNERMMIRVLAFALLASETLAFGKGISTDDEPALWDKDLTGSITQWVEVGLPDVRLVRRACGRAEHVSVLLYGGKTAEMWWQQNSDALSKQHKLTVHNVASSSSKALAALAEGSLDLQCTIQEGEVWIANADQRLQIEMQVLQSPRERY